MHRNCQYDSMKYSLLQLVFMEWLTRKMKKSKAIRKIRT